MMYIRHYDVIKRYPERRPTTCVSEHNPLHVNTTSMSKSSTTTTTTKASVAPLRKQALLLEARRNRVEWVESAAWPRQKNRYQRVVADDTIVAASEPTETVLEDEDGLALLRTSRVGENMKSVVDVLSNLYGNGDNEDVMNVKDRVVKQLLAQVSSDEAKRILGQRQGQGQQIEDDSASLSPMAYLSAAAESSDSTDSNYYHSFIQRLRSPEAAELVQGMRHFVACFDDAAKMSIEKKVSKIERDKQLRAVGAVYAKDLDRSNDDSDFVGMQAENEDAKAAAETIHAYLNLSYQSLKSNVLWKKEIESLNVQSGNKDEDNNPNAIAASLEIFIYQKVYECCWDMASDQAKDEELKHMVQSLQFVTWKHLDLNCLSAEGTTREHTNDGYDDTYFPIDEFEWKKILNRINSIDSHWSPTAKIQEMSQVLKDISEVLSSIVHNESNKSKTLPGADDILPTLILAIIKAGPEKLLSNLLFTQYYASPGQLRGEGGYVLTQFQSAIHFILGVDAASLTIDSSEFEKGLAKCREDVLNRKKLAQDSPRKGSALDLKSREGDNSSKTNDDDDELEIDGDCIVEDIPITDIQEAFKNGEPINIEWAKQWHEQRNTSKNIVSDDFLVWKDPAILPSPTKSIASSRTPSPNKAVKIMEAVRLSPFHSSLPSGFSRNYSFLGLHPNDIKFSDVPKLLEEYHQLVRACEIMIKERSALVSAEQKLKVKLARDQLESSVIAMDERKDIEDSFNSILNELQIEPSFSVETDGTNLVPASFVDNASV